MMRVAKDTDSASSMDTLTAEDSFISSWPHPHIDATRKHATAIFSIFMHDQPPFVIVKYFPPRAKVKKYR
jgi:hypothetical protein